MISLTWSSYAKRGEDVYRKKLFSLKTGDPTDSNSFQVIFDSFISSTSKSRRRLRKKRLVQIQIFGLLANIGTHQTTLMHLYGQKWFEHQNNIWWGHVAMTSLGKENWTMTIYNFPVYTIHCLAMASLNSVRFKVYQIGSQASLCSSCIIIFSTEEPRV